MDDCDSVARILARAFQNQCKLHPLSLQRVSDSSPVSVTWDAVEYANTLPRSTTLKKVMEESLLREYPPITPVSAVEGRTACLPIVPEPAVFTDSAGRLLAWSLPGIIPLHRQVSSGNRNARLSVLTLGLL